MCGEYNSKMATVLRTEFRFHNLGLNYDHTEYFTSAQWRWPRAVYLIYRIVLAIYTICAFIYMVINLQNLHDKQTRTDSEPYQHPPLIYVTLWSYLVVTLYCGVAAVIAAACYRRSGIYTPKLKSEPCPISSDVITGSGSADIELNDTSGNRDERDPTPSNITSSKNDNSNDTAALPWYSKMLWVLANINSSWAIIVTVIYFTTVFKPSWSVSANDVNIHILNSGIVLIDIFISARPVRLLHFFHPILFGVVYVIFSVVYWAVGNTNAIYENIYDWNNVGVTVGFVFGILLMILILHGISFACYRLRLLIFEKIYT